MKTIYPTKINSPTHATMLPCASHLKANSSIELRAYCADLDLTLDVPTKQYHGDGYFAASVEECLALVQTGLSDPKVGVILGLRGGYGSARLLPYLPYETIKKTPKIWCGYSDLTAILNAITIKTGLVTFHGPHANSVLTPFTITHLRTLLCEGKMNVQCEEAITLYPGAFEGYLLGGNFTVFNSLLGTPYLDTDWKDKILFFEDVGEDVYRIDRLLSQLELAGILEQIRGMILGSFTELTARLAHSFSLEEVFSRYVQRHQIPTIYGVPIGHQPETWVFPIGGRVACDATLRSVELLDQF